MSKFVPNSFQVPNAFVDEVLDKISDAATKIYLLTARKTRGWQKEMDAISTSQFEQFTGKSRPTVIRCIKELIAVGLLIECTENRHGKVYKLGEESYVGIRLKVPSKKSLLVKNFNYPSKKILLPLVKNFYPQKQLSKTTNQKNKKKGWLDLKTLEEHILNKKAGVVFEEIKTSCDLNYQLGLFDDYNADKQFSVNLKHAYFANWLIKAHNDSKQQKTASKKPESEKPNKGLSEKQIFTFAKKLSLLPEYAGKHAQVGETYEDLAKRISDDLRKPDGVKNLMPYLKKVGYEQKGANA